MSSLTRVPQDISNKPTNQDAELDADGVEVVPKIEQRGGSISLLVAIAHLIDETLNVDHEVDCRIWNILAKGLAC